MRILIISQWFDPEPTVKGAAFVAALVAQGHEVAVVTGFPNYPGGKVYPGYRIRPWQRERIAGADVIRVALWPSHSTSAVGRAANYLSFALTATIGVLAVKRPDIAYVYHPPGTTALPALLLKLLRGVPFVLDIQDLWPDTLTATGMVGPGRALRLMGAAMAFIYRHAARITVLSPGFRRILIERGVPDAKLSVISNWSFTPPAISDDVHPDRTELFGDARFVVLFAGTMGRAQALETVLDAAAILAERDPSIHFALMGGGIERDALARAAASRQLGNVRFIDRCSPAEAALRLGLADALLVHLRDNPLFAITIPSKTQAYLRSGKPILMGVRGDAAAMVEEAQAGLAFEPQNAQAMADAVLRLATMPQAELSAMGVAGSSYYARALSIEVGGQRMGNMLVEASQS